MADSVGLETFGVSPHRTAARWDDGQRCPLPERTRRQQFWALSHGLFTRVLGPQWQQDDVGPSREALATQLPQLERALAVAARHYGVWAGVPRPRADGPQLLLAPRHPLHALLCQLARRFSPAPAADDAPELARAARAPAIRDTDFYCYTTWWSAARQALVLVYRNRHGQTVHRTIPALGEPPWVHRLRLLLATHTAVRLDWRAERRALRHLHRLVGEEAWRTYLLTGSDTEVSPRRGRPAIASRHEGPITPPLHWPPRSGDTLDVVSPCVAAPTRGARIPGGARRTAPRVRTRAYRGTAHRPRVVPRLGVRSERGA